MRRHLLIALSVLSISAAGGVAFAQEGPGAPDLSKLHDALRLSPAQEGAWRAYTASIAPDPTMEARRRSASNMMRTLPSPRRVDLINAEMESEMMAMRRQGEAVKAFYAQLSPDQQRTFDAITLQQPEGQGGQ